MTTTVATPAFPAIINPVKLTPAEIRFYQDEGYLPLPGLVKAAAVEHLHREVRDILEANGVSWESLQKATSSADKLRQCSQYLAGSYVDGLINSPNVLAVASELIGGPAHRYMPFTAVKAAGGGGKFDFHQDNNYTQHEPAIGSLNIWVALVDMTPENGCLMMVPKSHLNGQLSSRESDDKDGHKQLDVDPMKTIPMRMRAGDAVAFTRWTVHGSGPNHTSAPRVAYALQYHREDVKYHDPATGKLLRLLDHPRWSTAPVQKLGPQ